MPRGCCAHRVSDASNKAKKSANPFLTITPFEIGGILFRGGNLERSLKTSPLLTQGMQKGFGDSRDGLILCPPAQAEAVIKRIRVKRIEERRLRSAALRRIRSC